MKKKECMIALLLCLMLAACTGCGEKDSTDNGEIREKGTDTAVSSVLVLDGRAEVKYTARDLDGSFDEATELTLKESYTITEAGIYVVRGTMDQAGRVFRAV